MTIPALSDLIPSRLYVIMVLASSLLTVKTVEPVLLFVFVQDD